MSGPRIDLTGLTFGKLYVMYYAGDRKWHCKCKCGTEKDIYYQHLVSGDTTSCGCNRKGVNSIDISGQRFGLLTAVSPTDKRCGNSIVWKCICECNKICYVAAIKLRNGNTKSCGCVASKAHSESMQIAIDKRSAYYINDTDLLNLPISRPSINNTSGYRGVSYDVTTDLWVARITYRHKRYHLGSSRNKDIAISLRKEADKHIRDDFIQWVSDGLVPFRDKLMEKYCVENENDSKLHASTCESE